MALTASPFDATTGELLPVYRDAYLRGDLSREHTKLVDAYLEKHAALGTQTWQRFHKMKQTGEQVEAVGWMQRQLALAQSSPQRVRRQAASLVIGAALVAGAVFAGTSTPSASSAGASADVVADDASIARVTTVRGRILDENGRPLVGATVLEKGAQRGVSTNADGEYALTVPVGRPTTLAYGYGGYTGEELQVNGKAIRNVTLVPNYEAPVKPARKAKRWFFFN